MRKSLRKAVLLGAITVSAPAAAQDGFFSLFSPKAAPSANTTAKEGQDSEASPTKVRQVATRLSTFGIPITALPNPESVKEIQLHVSADQGKSWHLYYRVAPTDKFFPFKAAADGEYWFATRMISKNAKSASEGELRPEMKVVIDTTPPRLNLTSELTPTGEVIAHWDANDPLLSPQTLRLEYQTTPGGAWRSIAIPNSGVTQKNGALRGKIAWFPREASGNIQLRAEIVDQAGNHAVAMDRLEQGAIARGAKPLEPPVAGPPAAPKQDGAKNEGALASVSKWLGGAFGAGGSNSATPEDPYASSSPSDALSHSEPSTGNAGQTQAKPRSSWGTADTELTDSGVRRIAQPRGAKTKEPSEFDKDANARHVSEKRGPGRMASAPLREPKREDFELEGADEKAQASRPTIQAPENSQRTGSDDPAHEEIGNEIGNASRDELPPVAEAEEIPPPRAEPRFTPADQRNEPAETETPIRQENRDRSRTVESLPNEESRAPIKSAPRKKPSEYRVRSPITSGLKGDEQGVARPPAAAPYRNASTARDSIASTSESGRLPAGVEPIYTKRPRFGLEYDVNTVGSSGVSEVELWATRDGGQSWSRWGSDPDRRSPFDVEVDGEGVFGFRIVVMSRGGLASRPPQPGDEADQWVIVDTSAPKVELRGAQYGAEERVGQLAISWDAQDANLTEKCVSLFYSDREEGPWTRIVSDLANQGEYFWRVDSRVPPRIYIKVEVRDGADNLASDQTRDAIKVEGLVPSGKIRRIIPREDRSE